MDQAYSRAQSHEATIFTHVLAHPLSMLQSPSLPDRSHLRQGTGGGLGCSEHTHPPLPAWLPPPSNTSFTSPPAALPPPTHPVKIMTHPVECHDPTCGMSRPNLWTSSPALWNILTHPVNIMTR